MFTEDNYIMWLSRQEGLPVKKKLALLKHFGNCEDIFKASRSILEETNILSPSQIHQILAANNGQIIEKYTDELFKKNIQFISINNKQYPKLLKEIYDPPIGFYMMGTMPDDDFIKIGVIGSRKCTDYGTIMAYKISKDLAANGIVIVSGMARGIDSKAHEGALDGNGLTIAVLGCGVDVCYPPENRELMKKICKNGCVISEYPPQTIPYKANFPVRNRIISGLSSAVTVVEAARQSGTAFTVNQALEQGRDIFAVPGNATSKFSEGTNDLIKDGAFVVTEAADILFALGIVCEDFSEEIERQKTESLAPDEKLVYDCISLAPISIDELIRKTNIKVQWIQYILTMLELKQYIKRIPGQNYIRKL